MEFGGFQKLTVLDYPSHVACIVFTNGCNFRCPFCHNALLVESEAGQGISEEEILSYLTKRQGVLDGVCISGGEPLMHPELDSFMKKVKNLGCDIKLDTNGSYPERLQKLVEGKLVDYVAMDIKNSFDKYDLTVGGKAPIDNIKKSIDFLLNSNVDYEFRTTVTNELHTPQDIEAITQYIVGAKRYFIQNFVDSGNILGSGQTSVPPAKLDEMSLCASKQLEFVKVR